MPTTYLGSSTVGSFLPTTLEATAIALGEVQAQVAGQLNVQAALTIGPPSYQATLDAAAALVASLQVTGPTATLQVSAIGDILLELQASLALLLALSATLGASGVHGWLYEGRADGAGPGISGAIGAAPPGAQPSDESLAITLMATTPAAATALRAVFGL